ncbi:unnamed protein product [Brachionus calyciflorus]|uniref:Uncharacterized protein n=1 Tax=Brachionus calyciflorus TaxID=104777 RepID=A0A813S2J2_9BILA|nr:unnamed protein product [Brachionus calyciflorus]
MSRELSGKSDFTFKFIKPTIIAFMGIPGSGKSTIAKEISSLIESFCYLEKEENLYPEKVRKALAEPDEHENILDIHFYFRNMRAEYHHLAQINKIKNHSTILDSFFSKLMLDILEKKDSATDWFINSKSQHFYKILDISKKDSANLTDADILIFLSVNKTVHGEFLKKRNRPSEVNENIYECQKVFKDCSLKYCEKNEKKFILIEQKNNLEQIVNLVIKELLEEEIICKII